MRKEVLKIIRSYSEVEISDTLLDSLVFDITRTIDDRITEYINNFKTIEKITINSAEKEQLRLFLLGYSIELNDKLKRINKKDFNISINDYENAYSLIKEGIKRNETNVINSLLAKMSIILNNNNNKISDDYKEYLKELEVGFSQLSIFNTSGLNLETILSTINNQYATLSNYHYMVLIFNGDWDIISKTAIYMENFKQEKNFKHFNKNKNNRINETWDFINASKSIKNDKKIKTVVEKYYDGVPYGFMFKDLFIVESSNIQILVMQKVQLDEQVKKCPSCLSENVRGNSYSKLLYKSFECSNPNCSDRSKIGRGKRYDLFGAKRRILISEEENKINDNIVEKYRKDVIKDFKLSDFVKLYSWSKDTITLINCENMLKDYDETFKTRSIVYETVENINNSGNLFNDLPIYKFFKEISDSLMLVKEPAIDKTIIGSATVLNGNSSFGIPALDNSFNAAITSPPYYNAREYSTWGNFNCHLIDMMINAKAVYSKMDNNGVYIYNVGDIVDFDYNFIHSNMSKRRLMLGFYSVFILELAGFDLLGNIIWDKGEVQSKRNSTPNKYPAYVNPINCYEHCLVFVKNSLNRAVFETKVKRVNTVKKINSKGQNKYGHTAPYPLDIANLILDFVEPGNIILDPFLGSGTTAIAMNDAEIFTIGFELDENYYKLAVKRIAEHSDTLFSL